MNTRNILLAITILCLGYGFFTRVKLLENHFTHIDDLIPALVESRLEDVEIDGASTLKKWIYQSMFFKVPENSTYAPFQFILTDLFLNNPSNYGRTKMYSRIPSLLFYVFSFPILLLISKRIQPLYWIPVFSIMSIVYCFSWMSIVYSVQSNTYIIGVFSCLTLLLFILNESNWQSKNKRFIYHFLIGFLLLFNYQMLIFLAGYILFLTTDILRKNKKENISNKLKEIGAMLLSMLPIFLYFMQSDVDRGVNWNAGVQNEFLFTLPEGAISVQLEYFFTFFVKNGILAVNAVSSPILSSYGILLTIILISVSIIGFYDVRKTRAIDLSAVNHFTVLSLLIYVMLILFGRLTLSPTRHSLILLPFLLFYSSIGTIRLLSYLDSKHKISSLLVILGVILYSSLFALNSKNEITQRQDVFEESYFKSLLDEYNIDIIIGLDWTVNHVFCEETRRNFERKSVRNRIFSNSDFVYTRKTPRSMKTKNILFLSTRRELDLKRFEGIDSSNIIFHKSVIGVSEVGPSNRTSNGKNSVYYNVLKFTDKELYDFPQFEFITYSTEAEAR